jgi:hypothetical protein
VVQAVTEFVEQGLHLAMREQGGLAADRRREVAGHVGDGHLLDAAVLMR